ncbi:ArsR/SmtB family transcription factor [Chitinimonas sp.]|uniref:ArsR/SmtB family transcription factor n=1 Tax=Chitinimonas sp. TaxID=1934313 RepID=UPI0035B28338
MTPEQLAALRLSAGAACSLLKQLANEDRLLLLCQLLAGEASVSELEAATGVRQPTLSQQLGVLRGEGLVSTRRDGKYIYYSLASEQAVRLLQVMHELFCPAEPPGEGDHEH